MEGDREPACLSSPGACPETVAFASMLAGTRGLEMMDDIMEARNFTNLFKRGQRIIADRNARNQGENNNRYRFDADTGLEWWNNGTNARKQGGASSANTNTEGVDGVQRQLERERQQSRDDLLERHDINQN